MRCDLGCVLPLPTIFRYDGFRFFFYSNEGNPREPMHVHVAKGGYEAKFWLEPDVAVAANAGSTRGHCGGSRW